MALVAWWELVVDGVFSLLKRERDRGRTLIIVAVV